MMHLFRNAPLGDTGLIKPWVLLMFDEEKLYDRMIGGHRAGQGRGKGSQIRLRYGVKGS